LEPNWAEIASEFGKTEDACKNRYRSLVDAEKELTSKLNRVRCEEIMNFLFKHQHKCEECEKVFYSSLKEWRGKMKCEKCYSEHNKEIEELWTRITEYSEQTENNFCKFCGLKRDEELTFHYDHINMFNKGDSICQMVRRGDDFERIKNEIEKCQLVCESCHHLITIMENMYGFTRVKLKITKDQNKEILTPALANEKTKINCDLYAENFEKIYNIIGSIVKK